MADQYVYWKPKSTNISTKYAMLVFPDYCIKRHGYEMPMLLTPYMGRPWIHYQNRPFWRQETKMGTNTMAIKNEINWYCIVQLDAYSSFKKVLNLMV